MIHGDPQTDTLVVTESPIEAMSYWSIASAYQSPATQYDILALGGATTMMGLEHYLSQHPNVKNLVVGLNNDSQEHGHKINAGMKGTDRIYQLFGQNYNIRTHTPVANDWNDTLLSIQANRALLRQMQTGRATQPHGRPTPPGR